MISISLVRCGMLIVWRNVRRMGREKNEGDSVRISVRRGALDGGERWEGGSKTSWGIGWAGKQCVKEVQWCKKLANLQPSH